MQRIIEYPLILPNYLQLIIKIYNLINKKKIKLNAKGIAKDYI
jgi:hypothetical protein